MGSYAEVKLDRQAFPSLVFQTFLFPNTASFSNHSFKGPFASEQLWDVFVYRLCHWLSPLFTEQTSIGCIIYYCEFHSHQQIAA